MTRALRIVTRLSAALRSRQRWRRYFRLSRRPLHSLIFLLPAVLLYEVGTLTTSAEYGGGRELFAHSVIQNLLGWFGLVGSWLPPVVLVVALLVWHHARRDPWRVRCPLLPGMLGESLLLAVPLLALSALFEAPPQARLLEALGAGIYEELVFRMLLISGLVWLLVELLRMQRAVALWPAAGLAAVFFALCHFQPFGSEWLTWKSFWFKLVAGLYLSAVFVGRGLGVAAGCHAAYNVLLVWLRSGGPR